MDDESVQMLKNKMLHHYAMEAWMHTLFGDYSKATEKGSFKTLSNS